MGGYFELRSFVGRYVLFLVAYAIQLFVEKDLVVALAFPMSDEFATAHATVARSYPCLR
jgi:hypothetical protein